MSHSNAARLFALLSPLLAGLQAGAQEAGGDPVVGATTFARCASCHALETERNGAGPHLVGLIGRTVGSVEGFRYSDALAEDDRTWDADLLLAYLNSPDTTMDGTRKVAALRDPQDIADVVADLASQAE
jgi:cytochrome c